MNRIIMFISACLLLLLTHISQSSDRTMQGTQGNQSPAVNVAPGGTSTINYGVPKRSGRKLIRGTTKILRLNREDINNWTRTEKIDSFQMRLDDPLINDYYVIKLHLVNSGTAIEQPLIFTISTGIKYSKFLDVQQKVIKPRNKRIKIINSIPSAEWKWSESGIKKDIECENSNEQPVGFNIYRSLLRDSGYGRANSTLITSGKLEIVEKERSELFPAYYKISAVNGYELESKLTDPIEIPNLAPFVSFVAKYPAEVEMNRKPGSAHMTSLDKSQLRFAEGVIDITFVNGLDANADVIIYMLCKIIPGSELAPSILLEGLPSVNFELDKKTRTIQSPPVKFTTDAVKPSLTPLKVTFYASKESIYLMWDKPNVNDFVGVRIYRTSERQLGDLIGMSSSDEIYVGPGLTKKITLIQPNIKEVLSSGLESKSEGILRYSKPPIKPKPAVQSSTSVGHIPMPPTSFNMGYEETLLLDSNYMIDTPAEGKTFTYVIYGYDKDGNVSYPVFVNAALAEDNKGVRLGITHE